MGDNSWNLSLVQNSVFCTGQRIAPKISPVHVHDVCVVYL